MDDHRPEVDNQQPLPDNQQWASGSNRQTI